MPPPLVSCVCLTYNRPTLLNEAVKCFLDQTYRNKELIIVNDNPLMKLYSSLHYSNIHIVNLERRFVNLGQKYNYAMTLVKGEYVCIWEDDDLYGINRIEDSVQHIGKYDAINPRKAIVSTDNTNYVIGVNTFHSQSCFTKKFVDSHTFANANFGIDVAYENMANSRKIEIEPYFWYIYRWGNTEHLSGIPREDNWYLLSDYKRYGEIELTPTLYRDYWLDVAYLYYAQYRQYYEGWKALYNLTIE